MSSKSKLEKKCGSNYDFRATSCLYHHCSIAYNIHQLTTQNPSHLTKVKKDWFLLLCLDKYLEPFIKSLLFQVAKASWDSLGSIKGRFKFSMTNISICVRKKDRTFCLPPLFLVDISLLLFWEYWYFFFHSPLEWNSTGTEIICRQK